MTTTKLPSDIAGVIKLLESTYPLRTFPVSTDAVTMHRHFGARDVIDHLRSLHNEAVGRLHDHD